MLEVADIFRLYGPKYLDRYGESMPARHHRVIRDILNCRTAALGGHLYTCDHCGEEIYSYHSCRNRHCPKCHTDQTTNWIESRHRELLPVTYFHLVFTVPEELNPLIRQHPVELYDVLMKAAAQSILTLGADPKYIGGLPGILAVLHTWTSTLLYHPHVHCLVTGGGLSPDRTEWLAARENYLLPVRALSKIFRSLFRDLAAKRLPMEVFPASAWEKEWVVFAKPAVQGTQSVLDYLGRYVHRVAISNRRILSIENDFVTFQYKDNRTGENKTITVTALEFIRRFLQHVLPDGTHKVRYFGLWSPTKRNILRRLQLLWAPPSMNDPEPPAADSSTTRESPARRCPVCGQGTLIHTRQLNRLNGIPRELQTSGRSPP
jgi:hypothetical protein